MDLEGKMEKNTKKQNQQKKPSPNNRFKFLKI